jgi:hypothetical protein
MPDIACDHFSCITPGEESIHRVIPDDAHHRAHENLKYLLDFRSCIKVKYNIFVQRRLIVDPTRQSLILLMRSRNLPTELYIKTQIKLLSLQFPEVVN